MFAVEDERVPEPETSPTEASRGGCNNKIYMHPLERTEQEIFHLTSTLAVR